MRFLIFLTCVVAFGAAAPQYSYTPTQPTDDNGFRGDKYLPPATTTAAPIIRKQFYLISAPEEDNNAGNKRHLILGRPQKNYRVVFIKAPSSSSSNVRLTAEYAPQEEKTVIYVLSKKDNDLNVGDIATPPPTPASKPEVFFIKYKTEEEARKAQKEIQNKYDELGGSNEFNNEGIAPITSVIGALENLTPDGGYDYKRNNDDNTPRSQYLPRSL